MRRLLQRSLAAVVATGLLVALVVVCPCAPEPAAPAHGCCGGDSTGMRAARLDCCVDGARQARGEMLQPASAPLALPAAAPAALRAGHGAPVLVPAASPQPSPPFSRPSVLRI